MKIFAMAACVISVLALAGCSTTGPAESAKENSETVLVTYHVQPGKEMEFRALLAHAWEVYRGEHLVFAEPHVIVRETEGKDHTRFIEIITWVKSPDHPPESVNAVWQKEESLCQARDGRRAIEGGAVELVTKH